MKKKTLKIGLIMACFAMICTSVVGFTLAKFATTNSVNDGATMAKWGVTVSASGTLFSETYNVGSPTEGITLSVDSNDTDKVVAPGTANDEGLTFGVTGSPEVAVNVAIAVIISDIYLSSNAAVNALLDPDLSTDYHPVVFVLNKGGVAVEGVSTLAQVETYLENLSDDYAANTDLATAIGEYTLTWSYAFAGNDAADTLLGNIAAAEDALGLTDVTDYELDISFNIAITVTQID